MANTSSSINTWESLIEKSWKDPDFKSSLINDPKFIIEQEMKALFPPGVEVKVLEDTANTMHLVLPAPPNLGAPLMVEDEEFENIALSVNPTNVTSGNRCCSSPTCVRRKR